MKITLTALLDNAPFGRFPSASTEYPLDKLLDARQGEFCTIWLTSTLNQAVTIQPIGNDQDDPGSVISPVDLGGSVSLPSGGTTTQRLLFTINTRDHRAQFYGLTVTTGATAPTAGRLDVIAYLWTPETDDLLREVRDRIMELPGGDGGVVQTLVNRANVDGLYTYSTRR